MLLEGKHYFDAKVYAFQVQNNPSSSKHAQDINFLR